VHFPQRIFVTLSNVKFHENVSSRSGAKIQGVAGVEVSTSGFNSRVDSESKKLRILRGTFDNDSGIMMWCGYIHSACGVRQTLMRGTQKRAEILLVLVRGLHWTM